MLPTGLRSKLLSRLVSNVQYEQGCLPGRGISWGPYSEAQTSLWFGVDLFGVIGVPVEIALADEI